MRLIDDMPADWREGTFLGRLLLREGPTPVLLRGGELFDISAAAPTTSHAIARGYPASLTGKSLGRLDTLDLQASSVLPRLLSPLDLQCVKASGVTFAVSAVERVIEERARGDAGAAQTIRAALAERVGADLSAVKPGSAEAAALKVVLIEEGL